MEESIKVKQRNDAVREKKIKEKGAKESGQGLTVSMFINTLAQKPAVVWRLRVFCGHNSFDKILASRACE